MFLEKFIRAARSLRCCGLPKYSGVVALILSLAVIQGAQAVPAQYPLFLAHSVTPVMMLTMDKDHQLYMKAYDDYSDITDSFPLLNGVANPNYGLSLKDGKADTTYVHKYQYYGYYDNKICYSYSFANKYFAPIARADADGYCSGAWAGNFLNWATMTRIDIVRKILYGGMRSTDTDSETVLERAYLPTDAHSFAKYYNGADIGRLTPFSNLTTGLNDPSSGITLCNTTPGSSATVKDIGNDAKDSSHRQYGYSQSNKNPPLIRVVKGNYSLWASSERWQCKWGDEGGDGESGNNNNALNGNNPTYSGIYAYPQAPWISDDTTKLSSPADTHGEYVARVKVCTGDEQLTPKDIKESNCKQYESATYANKPAGLLQKYGEPTQQNGKTANSQIKFGLITGSYGASKSGGVLRKNVGDMSTEIELKYGKFNPLKEGEESKDGRIINSLNSLRMYGYRYWKGDYAYEENTDWCDYSLSSFADGKNGKCKNWGNPQSEIYYEALRYLAGVGATPEYSQADADSKFISGLTQVAWTKPVTNSNYCAPLSVLQFSGASSSYDADLNDYKNTGNINLTDLKAAINDVGTLEDFAKAPHFVGKVDATSSDAKEEYQLCTAKTVNNLSEVSGICPESPRLEGGYAMVGLARHARLTGIPLDDTNPKQTSKVRTFGVALAAAVPKVEVAVPGSTKTIIIQPACRNISYRSEFDVKNSPKQKYNGPEDAGKITPTNCAIVDFKVVSQTQHTHTGSNDIPGFPESHGSGNMGTLYVNWEDSEQGGDYDQDMWGTITYLVTATNVYIKTQVIQKSTSRSLGFGYVLSGTGKEDGFHVHSGVNYFQDGVLCKAQPKDGASKPDTTCTCAVLTTGQNFDSPVSTFCDGDKTKNSGVANTLAQTYTISTTASATAASFLLSPLYYAAKWGGYDSIFAGKKTGVDLDKAVLARDPTDNNYFFAANPRALAEKLDAAFLTIASDKGVASGVATNNNYLEEGTYIFRSEFNSFDWSGAVKAFAVDADGDLKKTNGVVEAAYSTATAGKIPADRTIYTNNGTSTPVRLDWETLTSDQKIFLSLPNETKDDLVTTGPQRVNWLKGSAENEGPATFRVRTTESGVRNILGDLVNSSPVYVGATNYHYDSFDSTKGGGKQYIEYVKAKSTKTPRIYVGGNDGMVHAFNASSKNPNNLLEEMYAFIPTSAFPKLLKLMRPDYGTTSNPHQYVVDGPIATGDVYINGTWRTIIVGTLGGGGRGIYALEVMSEGESGDSPPKVLFELNEKTHPALGYVLGTPVIAPMANGRWAVVFGNGDTSSNIKDKDDKDGVNSNATSQLFVVDIEEPLSKTKVINTKEGTGLSAPALLPNSQGQAKVAYAGDLKGNMWHFDLTGTETNAFYAVFKATESVTKDALVQPIVAAPTLGINSKKANKIMVYFGTGKYYDAGDNEATVKPRHSFYAIVDKGETVPRTDSALYKKSYTGTSITRTMVKADVDWNKYDGWYLDLGGDTDPGERVTTSAILIEDKLIFPTLITSERECDNGGASWLMEVPAVGNKFVDSTALKNNIRKSGLVLGNISIGKSKGGARILGSTTDAKEAPIDEPVKLNPGSTGRQSWRQVR